MQSQQRQDFTVLATEGRNYMERTITLIGEGFTAVRGEVSELGTDVTELRAGKAAAFASAYAKFDQVNAEIRGINDQLAT